MLLISAKSKKTARKGKCQHAKFNVRDQKLRASLKFSALFAFKNSNKINRFLSAEDAT